MGYSLQHAQSKFVVQEVKMVDIFGVLIQGNGRNVWNTLG